MRNVAVSKLVHKDGLFLLKTEGTKAILKIKKR